MSPSPEPTPSTDIRLLIGRMDGKLDLLLTHSANHEARLQSLEAWKNKAMGWLFASAAAGGVASDQIINLMFR